MTKAKPKLTKKQRDKIADKLMTLGNIIFSGLVIAPLGSSEFQQQQIVISLSGGVLFASTYLGSVWIMKGGDKS